MENKLHKRIDDGLSFNCEICQDRGCQNCQGEYKGGHDPVLWQEDNSTKKEQRPDKDEVSSSLPNPKIEDDGLSFDCEYCQDAPGGCPQCGFGKNRR